MAATSSVSTNSLDIAKDRIKYLEDIIEDLKKKNAELENAKLRQRLASKNTAATADSSEEMKRILSASPSGYPLALVVLVAVLSFLIGLLF